MPGCGFGTAGRMMCHAHWLRVPLPLQKTLLFLYSQGSIRDGFDEALANAVMQVQQRERARFPEYLGSDPQ